MYNVSHATINYFMSFSKLLFFLKVGEGAKGFFITREGDLNSVDLSAKGERTVKKIIKLAKQSASRPIHMVRMTTNNPIWAVNIFL